MPPDSSKNRSNMTVSSFGRRPERRAAGGEVLDRVATPQPSSMPTPRATQSVAPVTAVGTVTDFHQTLLDVALSRDTACDSSSLRPGASPNQKGIEGGSPWASSTRTVPRSTRRIR